MAKKGTSMTATPGKQEKATETVLEQAVLLSETWAGTA